MSNPERRPRDLVRRRLPARRRHPHLKHPLAHGELIVGIEVPGTPIAGPSAYLKLRDRLIDDLTLVEFDGGAHNIACAYPTR